VEDSKKYWVGFNLVKGIGSARLKALLDFFGDIERAWNAPADVLRSTGLGSKQVNAVLEVRSSDMLDRTWEFILKRGITVINWEDGDYPRYLKEIALPPPVLYMRGNLLEEDDWSVAVISGLARAVVVVEAGKRSGALITAAFAADQGRDVFAVPGNVYAPQSIGTNLLIQQGASPLLDPQDVLESLNLAMLGEHRAARPILPADATEAKLYSILGHEPLLK